MNAPFQFPLTGFVDDVQALAWAKEWRSDCLDAFARVETRLGDLLKAMADASLLLGKVKIGQPTRPSFDHLREKLQAKGHWKGERRRFDASLDPLERLLDFRPQVAHGELRVWHGRSGQWLLTLRQPEGHCAGPIRWHAYPFKDADAMRTDLQSRSAAFVDRAMDLLEQLRKAPNA